MIRSYWNALRVNDVVAVHDDSDDGFALSAGTVARVGSRTGNNDVAIRLDGGNASTVLVRPKRLAVHLGTARTRSGCWRCAARK